MRHAMQSALLVSILLANVQCSNSTGPDNSVIKHPRSYRWVIDTVAYPPRPKTSPEAANIFWAFWGMGDTLIYAVGEDIFGGYNAMWKFNGIQWERIKLLAEEGGPIPSMTGLELNVIRGFAPNDIYAFGNTRSNYTGSWVYTPVILHYNGIRWQEVLIPKGGRIFSAIAPSPTQIYCSGQNGTFYSFNGFTWSLDTIRYSYISDLPISTGMIGQSRDGSALLQTQQYDPETGVTYSQFLKYKDKRVTLLDSTKRDFPWNHLFWQSPSGTTYANGARGVYRLNGEKWENFYSGETMTSIAGASDNHMFAVSENKLYFFDGTTWEVVYTHTGSPFWISRAWCTERQVFVAFFDSNWAYILHGR